MDDPVVPAPAPAPEIDAELMSLVSAPPPVLPLVVRVKSRRVGPHTFIPVVFGSSNSPRAQHLHRLSQREAKFVKTLLDTDSIELAADEIGISRKVAMKFARKKAVVRYLNDMLEQRALAAGVTVDKLLAHLNRGIDGEEVTDTQLECIKTAARIIRPEHYSSSPSVGSITVNQQNNFNGPSPYADMSKADLLKDLRAALLDGDTHAAA